MFQFWYTCKKRHLHTKLGNYLMGDVIGSCSPCFGFHSTYIRSEAQFVEYGRLMTLDDSLSLNLNRCHHPLITQLS